MRSVVVNLGLLALTCLFMIGLGEAGVRLLDGYRVLSIPLRPSAPTAARNGGAEGASPMVSEEDQLLDQEARRLARLPIDWFNRIPPPATRVGVAPEPLIRERREKYPSDPYGSTFVWNRNYLRKAVCDKSTLGSFGILNEFFYFNPARDDIYPYYRHMTSLEMPDMFKTNSFGWRGPDLDLNPPPGVIRIAFAGASTTINEYGASYSYPEYVGHWLNRWAEEESLSVRFEIINAGRTGIDSPAIAAIVRDELLPVRPDLVVYYEGSNQFHPADYVTFEDGTIPEKPTATFKERSPLERYSAVVQRAFQMRDRLAGAGGYEPIKPAYRVSWPPDLDEFNPDIRYPRLPLRLNAILSDLDSMRRDLEGIESQLVVSSFVWMAQEGMRVNLDTNPQVYRHLNETFWPFSYRHIRRMADFQNRAFRNFARDRNLPFLDVAARYPMDTRFFGDAIHMTGNGVKLHAWIAFQELVPVLRQKIDQGLLPKRRRERLTSHPAFAQPRMQLVTRAELERECASSAPAR